MIEFLSANLLGVIGTVTGIAALIISYRTYSKQKPNLKITVKKCLHDFPNPNREPQVRDINFDANFQIRNVGDRGTKIEKFVLSFEADSGKYQVEEKTPYSELSEITRFFVQSPVNEGRWIEAHNTVEIGSHFKVQYDRREIEKIDCVFTVYDTHKKYVVKGISTKVARPPLEPEPYKKPQ